MSMASFRRLDKVLKRVAQRKSKRRERKFRS